MIAGLSAATIGVIIIGWLFMQGGTGRFGIVLAAMAGSALGIAGTLLGVFMQVGGALVQVAQSVGQALG